MAKKIVMKQYNEGTYDILLPDNASSETKSLYGLTDSNNTDDILKILTKTQAVSHRWKKYNYNQGSYVIQPGDGTTFGVGATTFYYSANLSISSEGGISLVDASSINISYNNPSSLRTFLNSIKGQFLKKDYNTEGTVTYYKNSTDAEGYNAPHVQVVTGVAPSIGTFVEYVYSSNINAYPQEGVQGEYYYFLADNLEIEVGSYVGTGSYGSSNPTSLTFNFIPKMVVVGDSGGLNPYKSSQGWDCSFFWFTNTGVQYVLDQGVLFNKLNKTLSWYSSYDANTQLNANSNTYRYLAIG